MSKLRILSIAIAVLGFSGIAASAAQAATNPVQYQGHPMSCPDPDVFQAYGEYVASCTSDYAPHGLPIYVSHDLVHWQLMSYVFPHANGRRFWADEIHHIGRYWIAYYGEEPNARTNFRIYAAWTTNLFGGRWHSKVLVNVLGTIDPSVANVNGQLEMVFLNYDAGIRIVPLTADGLHLAGGSQFVTRATLPWEDGWVEGPVLWQHDGVTRVFYNAASTWNDSYSIGIMTLTTHGWVKNPQPILHAGPRLVSTGIGAQPFMGPHGLMLAFHVQFHPATHSMLGRYLAFAPLSLVHGVPHVKHNIPPSIY